MAGQERLSVEAAAERLGITPDAVRSRIKRGSLWAVRREGRVMVVLDDPSAKIPGTDVPVPQTRNPQPQASDTRPEGEAALAHAPATAAQRAEAERLRDHLEREQARVHDLEGERERLLIEIERQQKMIELEYALRARLQDQIDRLSAHVAAALPEPNADAAQSADRLWRRLERQVDRANQDPPERSR